MKQFNNETMVIPCIRLRNEIAENIKIKINELKSRGVVPSFAIIQIGDNPASNIYIQVKTKKATELGIKTQLYKFQFQNPNFQTDKPITGEPDAENRKPRTDNRETSQQQAIEELIQKLNIDPKVHGIIIQRPIPENYDEHRLQSMISSQKDIDGLSENSPFVNPLVQAVLHAIKFALPQSAFSLPTTDLPRRQAGYRLRTVVVGKGKSAGSPIFNYFSHHPEIRISTMNYELITTQIDSSTPNPADILKNADLIISCVGKERIVNATNIKKGAILISVGQHIRVYPSEIRVDPSINRIIKWSGDYDEQEIANIASYHTRTPGGIGPLNVIFLLQNVIKAVR